CGGALRGGGVERGSSLGPTAPLPPPSGHTSVTGTHRAAPAAEQRCGSVGKRRRTSFPGFAWFPPSRNGGSRERGGGARSLPRGASPRGKKLRRLSLLRGEKARKGRDGGTGRSERPGAAGRGRPAPSPVGCRGQRESAGNFAGIPLPALAAPGWGRSAPAAAD
ncbi:unnamed protein product, partial [Bubo scandiacus]